METAELRSILEKNGISEYGFAEIDQPLSLDRYKTWIANGYQGDMGYLERHIPLKETPTQKYPQVKSAIVFRHHYFKFPEEPAVLPGLRVALYAQAKDYHEALPQLYQKVLVELQEEFPGHYFGFHTDSGPVLERDLAYRAGLGWFGKNSMLIDDKKGSFFFLAEILTSLPLSSAKVFHPDRCGTCTRCIDACPTDAILPDRQLDARKCISYLTIETKSIADENLRAQVGNWFFGCDICQLVCPWNEKLYGKSTLKELLEVGGTVSHRTLDDLRWILTADDSTIQSQLKQYPLIRPKPWGLRRNALIIVGNHRLIQLKTEVELQLQVEALKDLAQWVLERFHTQ